MLLFRDEEHVVKWCKQWNRPRGAVLSLTQTWKLADAWYRDRMKPEWRRRTVEEAHALFESLGLNGDFWRFN